MKKALNRIYLVLIIIFLYAPILTLMVLSFNNGRSMGKWTGFSLHWYAEMLEDENIMGALKNTLLIALIASVVSTIIGTAATVAIQRMRPRTRSIILGANNIPLLNADIVTGISLMLMFVAFGITLSMGTVILAHITFCIPYVILSVLPRAREIGSNSYEAALDLGATPMYAFFKVTLPELKPGIISGFLLAFTMSVDDFIVTHFTRGAGVNTLSTMIYGSVKIGIRPTIYALSTIVFMTVLVLLIIANVVPARAEKRRKGKDA